MAYDPAIYRRLQPVEHIYHRPDTYLGPDKRLERKERLLACTADDKMRFVTRTIDFPIACEHIFAEILSNAGDNVERSRLAGMDPGTIVVTMGTEWISVRNGGIVIPVAIHEKEGVYAPELIFSILLTGSNYNDDEKKTWGGRNGYGAKLCNIFSSVFVVRVGDTQRRLSYEQVWQNNLRERGEPKIAPYNGPPYVEVLYKMDFARFGYESYPQEAVDLFARKTADVAFSCRVAATFNGRAMGCEDLRTYASLCFGETPHSFVHIEKEPAIELFVTDAVDHGRAISFVNGIEASEGGVHVDKTYEALRLGLCKLMGSTRADTSAKTNANKARERKRRPIQPRDITRHVAIILSCRLVNPVSHTQSKSKLGASDPPFRISLPAAKIKSMLFWPFVDRLQGEMELRASSLLAKTDGKGRRKINVERVEDANDAGIHPVCMDCILLVLEGKSAMGYGVKARAHITGGHDRIGLFPMKGKPLNVSNANFQQIAENVEISNLKEVLGLREGAKYDNDKEYHSLRYGHLGIMTDADDDGKHIAGLIMNIFHRRWPELLGRGFVKYVRTPIVVVTKSKMRTKFYALSDYEDWRKSTPDHASWEPKYFKGLAAANDLDVADEFSAPKIVTCEYDSNAPGYFRLAFEKAFVSMRRLWMEQYVPREARGDFVRRTISDFFDRDFIEYNITNVKRSIPRMDGLKRSQRQIIFGCAKWKGSRTVKVGRVAFRVADITAYHYGEKSLIEAINSMAMSYTGSNNLPYFVQDGMFGTRNMEGKDTGEARYCATKPEWWWPLVFREEDKALCTHVVEEDEEREPTIYLPIVPLLLVNGCNGIATGWSTFIPPHNPLDICDWLVARIKQQPLPAIKPWYRGFIGAVDVRLRRVHINTPKENASEDPLGPDEVGEIDEPDPKVAQYSLVTEGVFRLNDKGDVIVTELPITRAFHSYDTWLKKQRAEGHIRDFRSHCTSDRAYFEIRGFVDPTIEKLRLRKSFGLSNMVVLDAEERPRRFASVDALLEEWYRWRAPYYTHRKEANIARKNTHLAALKQQLRLITAVRDGEITIFNRPEAEVYARMDELGLPRTLLKRVRLHGAIEDSIAALEKRVDQGEEEIAAMTSLPASALWLRDIAEFLQAYLRHYVDDRPRVVTELVLV